MSAEWITSPSGRRVQQHAADTRPAWLWSQDGQTLLWQNDAATLFLAKVKKHGLKLAAPAVPIKGQIARNIRLGLPGRTSLARIQFLAGERPGSGTFGTTPLVWEDGQPALLIVGVDPIAQDVLDAAAEMQAGDGQEAATVVDDLALQDVPQDVPSDTEDAPQVIAEPDGGSPEDRSENDHSVAATPGEEAAPGPAAEGDAADAPQLTLAHDTPEASPAQEQDILEAEIVEPLPVEQNAGTRLSRLVDQLAADTALFSPLTDADDQIKTGQPLEATSELETERTDSLDDAERVHPETDPAAQTDAEADLGALAILDGTEPAASDGNAFRPEASTEQPEFAPVLPVADVESVERVSRYNFDELSRILNDRVGDSAPLPALANEPQRSGALINLGGETLVLNRLPLGILVFRDQQVLFANRAITEMIGYNSVESLREAGLSAVFPAAGPEGQEAGPVNHLVQRDGTLVPVTARLQSISWQGRPALMLSASATEVRTSHETAVRAFAQTAAELRGDGFFEANRNGVINSVSPGTAELINFAGSLEGKPLSSIVASTEIAPLQAFLERPARFAESERPYLALRAASGKAEILLFAQGQAGVVNNYFGFVRGRETAPLRVTHSLEADPALLARISRGVRRPLNTIIGFAELLRTQAFRGQEDKPFEGYAQDISTAGQDIAALVDELESYARLRDGRYLPQRSSIELTSLLENCVIRIRPQANGARVIVRNAIAENLPRVTADRASLEQAVLNLLASAIDQSPTGGAVVISAKREDDGGIAVHVRDSSNNAVDMAERFVVFRDGVSRGGQLLAPVRSSVGLALTRSLLAVNSFSLSVDPAGERGLLFTLLIPADLVEKPQTAEIAE